MSMKVGIQGGKGSFNEAAFRALQKRGDLPESAEPLYLFTTKAVLDALTNQEIDRGVFAIYNSKSQLVEETAPHLGPYVYSVTSYITIPIKHYLMQKKGTEKDFDAIMGHEEAIAQCTGNLTKDYAHIPKFSGEADLKDGAGVAQAVLDGRLEDTTAILSGTATAEAFNLDIISDCLADDPHNATTFLLVSAPQ